MIATQEQIKQTWIDHGGQRAIAKVMSAIAMAESSGDSEKINDNPATRDYSVGWWQINYYGELYNSRSKRYGKPEELQKDVALQVRAAKSLAAGGAGLHNWTQYTNGTYMQFMGKGAASNSDLPTQNTDRPSWAERNIPGVAAFNTIGDVVRFLYEEHGLIRIAEVILGFGALTLGAAALMIDAAKNSETGQIALRATGIGTVAATSGKVRNAATKAANPKKAAQDYRSNRDSAKFEKKYGVKEEDSGKFQNTKRDFPRAAVIEGSPMYRHKQTESARRRNSMTAEKRRAMSGDI